MRPGSSDDPHGDGGPVGGPRPGDRLLAGVLRRAGPWLIPLLVLEVLGAAGALALPALLGLALDRVVAAPGAGDATVRSALLQTAALVGFLVVADAASQLLVGGGTARATGALRHDLVRQVLARGPALWQRTAEGDLVARLVGSAATAGRVVALAAGLTARLVTPVGGVVALAVIDPFLALTFAAGMVLASGAVRAYLRDAHAATTGYQEAQGAIAARLVDALAGARSIAAARITDREIDRVLVPLRRLRRHGVATWQAMARLALRGEPVVLLTQVAVVAVAGARLASGDVSAGGMLAASRYAVMAAGIGSLLGQLGGLTRARAGAHRVAEVASAPATAYGDRPLPPGPGTLELRGVTAGRPDAPVLAGLDLEIPGGALVALVGRSGTGKSLVAALAGRLCDPDAGEVRLDGVPLRQLDRRTLRRAVAYAFERPVLVGATIGDAVGLGPDPVPPGRVRLAARAARADVFVERLPGGYAAPLAATPLSGGERQRLGLARALARDARLLVLDDATSSLDTATEAEIATVLTTEMAGRTRLVVTHRVATAARADLVAWLDGGRIRALGPHRRLWADPDYRAIFRPAPAAPGSPGGGPAGGRQAGTASDASDGSDGSDAPAPRALSWVPL